MVMLHSVINLLECVPMLQVHGLVLHGVIDSLRFVVMLQHNHESDKTNHAMHHKSMAELHSVINLLK